MLSSRVRKDDTDRVIETLKTARKDGDPEVSDLAGGLVEDLERATSR